MLLPFDMMTVYPYPESHLGPDGSQSYTSSVDECISAILRERMLSHAYTHGVTVTWGGIMNCEIAHYHRVTLPELDPFHWHDGIALTSVADEIQRPWVAPSGDWI